MTLTWGQISTAFDALVNLCIDRPIFTPTIISPKGGHATFSANPGEMLGRKKRKSKREEERNGTDALPPGARIDLWKHGGNGATLACEFAAVLRGQKLDSCATS